ncbi:hypothetical protein AX14_009986 [Amanita brunnescens Koide BX004]|nr:hypothetical protein AX14_009986 [Amanita brunnescens Koide BX004]
MAPRHRQPQPGQLRSHSRSSSSSRVCTNLQLTQKDSSKHPDKTRRNDFHNKPHPGFVRRPSTKPGFTLSHQGEQDDEDEWVSTESGAASPDHSDYEPNVNHLQLQLQQLRLPDEQPLPCLDRSETPRVFQTSDVQASHYPIGNSADAKPPQTPPSEIYNHYFLPEERSQLQRALSSETMRESPPPSNMPPSSPSKQKLPGSRRRSRPSSMHSTSSRNDPTMRPHPLCYVSKQGPLAPLAVIPDSASIESTSAEQPYHDGDEAATSPSSTASDAAPKRRSSISSARSVSTVPVFRSKDTPKGMHERTRTLSTIPTSSSSAALSSLTHLPSVTRPPSPQPVVFFPPHNPHANIDGIHPLLPSPYMSNHMTVLMRRTPLKESYDRVMRSKLAAASR